MTGDWGFVVWIVIIAIPLGTALATGWSRSRGERAMLNQPDREEARAAV